MDIKKLGRRLQRPAPNTAIFPTDAAIILGTTFGSMALFIGLSVAIANVLQTHFITVAISMPRLHVEEWVVAGTLESCSKGITGCTQILRDSPVLVMYMLLREHLFDRLLLFGVGVVLLMFMLEMGGLVKNTTKPYITRIIIAALLVMALPFFWDYLAEGVEYGALKLLNPLFTLDAADPCIKNIDNPLLASLAEQNRQMAQKVKPFGLDTVDDQYYCSPNLRIHYIFSKAFHGASYDVGEEKSFFEGINQLLGQLGANVVNTLWGGITKATMITFTTMYAIAMLVGSKVWLSSILTIFPLLVLLTFIPKVGAVPKKILEMLPGLIMIPIMVAAVIVGGSTGLFMIEQKIADGESLYAIGVISQDGQGTSSQDGPADFVGDSLIFWMTAVTVLLIAATTPALLVPSLMSLSSTVGSAVGSAAVSGIVGVSAVAKGAGRGGGQALAGSFAAAKAAPGGTLGNLLRPETFKNAAAGIGGGGAQGSRAALDADIQGGLGSHGMGGVFKGQSRFGDKKHKDSSDPRDPSVIDSGSKIKDRSYKETFAKSTARDDKKIVNQVQAESDRIDDLRTAKGKHAWASPIDTGTVDKQMDLFFNEKITPRLGALGEDTSRQFRANIENIASSGQTYRGTNQGIKKVIDEIQAENKVFVSDVQSAATTTTDTDADGGMKKKGHTTT